VVQADFAVSESVTIISKQSSGPAAIGKSQKKSNPLHGKGNISQVSRVREFYS
jgi:hypothetical protein